MDTLPASSTDIATIRIVADRHKLNKEFDANDNISMIERFFSSLISKEDKEI
jgi:hypothetical protein